MFQKECSNGNRRLDWKTCPGTDQMASKFFLKQGEVFLDHTQGQKIPQMLLSSTANLPGTERFPGSGEVLVGQRLLCFKQCPPFWHHTNSSLSHDITQTHPFKSGDILQFPPAFQVQTLCRHWLPHSSSEGLYLCISAVSYHCPCQRVG